MSNIPLIDQNHPVTDVASKYWWLSIPIVAVTAARAIKRKRSGEKWHDQAFGVANDLGVISFPVTAMIMIYEFGKTQKQVQQVSAKQSAPMPGA